MEALAARVMEYANRLPEGTPAAAKELLHLGSLCRCGSDVVAPGPARESHARGTEIGDRNRARTEIVPTNPGHNCFPLFVNEIAPPVRAETPTIPLAGTPPAINNSESQRLVRAPNQCRNPQRYISLPLNNFQNIPAQPSNSACYLATGRDFHTPRAAVPRPRFLEGGTRAN